MKVLILSILFTVAFAHLDLHPDYVGRPYPDGRIVGGKDADIADFPYQVSMQKNGYHICGASIISKNWIITAAHCLQGFLQPSTISFRIGSAIHNKGGKIIKATQIFNHPKYNDRTMANDVALVMTEEDLTGENVSIVNLPHVNANIKIGKTGLVSGWGDLEENGYDSPENLQYVAVNVIDQDVCQKALSLFGGVDESMFCAGNKGKDSCQGDSGGPIVIDGTLVGVVSWGIGCANPRYPGVYTRLAHPVVRDWLMNIALI